MSKLTSIKNLRLFHLFPSHNGKGEPFWRINGPLPKTKGRKYVDDPCVDVIEINKSDADLIARALVSYSIYTVQTNKAAKRLDEIHGIMENIRDAK